MRERKNETTKYVCGRGYFSICLKGNRDKETVKLKRHYRCARTHIKDKTKGDWVSFLSLLTVLVTMTSETPITLTIAKLKNMEEGHGSSQFGGKTLTDKQLEKHTVGRSSVMEVLLFSPYGFRVLL